MLSLLPSIRNSAKSENIFRVATSFLILCAFLAAISETRADPDLWGHLRFGLDILEARHIVKSDPYSYMTAGQEWMNHEWLAEVLFASAWKAGGARALVSLKVAIGLLMAGILCAYLSHVGLSMIRVGILLFLAFLPMKTTFMPIRPHLFTSLLFLIVVLIITHVENGRYRLLWIVAPIFALWVNLHGGFFAGVGIMAIWALGHMIRHRDSWPRIIPPLALATAATALNPYGIHLLVFLFKTATVPRPEISEWQPISLASLQGLLYLILLFVCVAGLILSRKHKQVALIYVFAAIALSPLLALRHLELFPFAGLVLCAPHIKVTWDRIAGSGGSPLASSILFDGIAALAGLILLIWAIPRLGLIRIEDPELPYPQAAVALVKETGIKGNLAVDFNWGEYAIWHLGPGVKVSMDGRRETVYSPEVYDLFLDYNYGSGQWDRLLTRYPTQMVLVRRYSPTYNLVSLKTDWSLVYEDEVSAFFAKRDFGGLAVLKTGAAQFRRPAASLIFP